MTTPSQAGPTTMTTSTSNGLPMTWPPTSSGGKRRRPHAKAAVERADMADDNHKRRKRRTAPSVDDDHRAHSTAATKALAEPDAGSPIAALPAEMLHAVLSRVDDLDLPACLFVCLGWAQTIADRAAHAARALLPRRPSDHLRDVDSAYNRHVLVIPQRKQVSSSLVRFQPRRHVGKAPGDRCIVHLRARPRVQWATVLSGPLQSGEVPIGSSHQLLSPFRSALAVKNRPRQACYLLPTLAVRSL